MGIEHEIRVTHLHPSGAIDTEVDVFLVGEFDLSTAAELHESLVKAEVSRTSRVHVHLTHVSFLDSITIDLLMATCKRVRNADGTFSVSCATGHPALQLLTVAGLVDYFEVQRAA